MPKKIGINTLDYDSCGLSLTAKIFGITVKTLYSWLSDGCPSNFDKTYSTKAVFKWRIRQAEEKAKASGSQATPDLQRQKMEKEIEYKDAQIQKLTSSVIERGLHEKIMCSRASALRQFIEQSSSMNAKHFVGLSLEEARVHLLDFCTQMMKAYTGGYSEKETTEIAEG